MSRDWAYVSRSEAREAKGHYRMTNANRKRLTTSGSVTLARRRHRHRLRHRREPHLDRFQHGQTARADHVGDAPDDQRFRTHASLRQVRRSRAAIGLGTGLPATVVGIAADYSGKAGSGGSGITTLESEFLANLVLPDGGTVGDWLAPQIDEAYATGRMPPMLGPG